MDNAQLIRRIDAMINARNVAGYKNQQFRDAHIAVDGDETSQALYEASYELVHAIDVLLDSVEFQNLMLGLRFGNNV